MSDSRRRSTLLHGLGVAVARTPASVRKVIAEAVALHVQVMRQRGQKVPNPTTVSHTVELQSA